MTVEEVVEKVKELESLIRNIENNPMLANVAKYLKEHRKVLLSAKVDICL